MFYKMKTTMLSTKQKSSFIFPVLFFAFTLPVITTLPVPSRDDLFAKFVENLTQNNCSMPSVVDIPFPTTESSPFNYLSTPLKECQSPEALKENNEANLLCREAFDVLKNITCNDYSSLPKINSSGLSTNICTDFSAIQEILPKQKEYLSGKLGDKVICKILCTEKYELLCKTLLWSYDTQAKIKNALDSKMKENEKENMNNVAPNENDPKENGSEENHKTNEISDKTNAVPGVSGLSKFGNESLLKITPFDEISNNKNSPLVNSSKDKLTNSSQTVQTKINTQVSSQKSTQDEDIQPTEQNPELPDEKNIEEKENVIKSEPNNQVENLSSKVTTKDISNESGGSNTSIVTESDAKSIPVVKPLLPDVGLQEPQEDLKKQGNSKENFVSDGVTLETDLNLPSTVLSELERPEGKDPELYNDSENDGDYPKQEYDNGFSSLKKDSDVKNSVVEDGSSQMSSSSSIRINPDSFAGQFDGSQSLLPARKYLPEQEDSHFFFYFLSIVLILMAGYLIFHNKQKIIALIVEGRHERRRRSHGAGYKKLETK